MKTKILSVLLTLLVIIMGCSKQNTPEPLLLIKPAKLTKSEAEALRAYKKSDHPIFFGYYGSSSSPFTSNMKNRYAGLPDSIDIVALWGGFPSDAEGWAELRMAQEEKGIRFVMTMFSTAVDDLIKKNFSKLDVLTGIDSVAKSIADTVAHYKLDGFDLDYEPNFGGGGIFGHGGGGTDAGGDVYTQRLFKALSKYLGPLSGTGKLLIIDGESEKGIATYIDYLVQQAYEATSPANLQFRFKKYGFGTLPPKKFIVIENFQRSGSTGGVKFTDPVRGVIPSLIGMAYWNPVEGRKGGTGTYIMESDQPNKVGPFSTYGYTRTSIQIMNPSPGQKKLPY